MLEPNKERLRDFMEAGTVFYDGLDAAIVGTVRNYCHDEVVCYDYDKCVAIFMLRDSMDFEEAIEWVDYNVVRCYVGERSPMFLEALEVEDGTEENC